MEAHSRVLSALSLLLLYSAQILAKKCIANPLSSYVAHVDCNYRSPFVREEYHTKVKLTIRVSKPTQGWQLDLHLSFRGSFRVKSISGGELNGSETRQNGIITLRNTVPRLAAGDRFRVGFIVQHGQSNTKLFPAKLHLNLPTRHITGVCDGPRQSSQQSSHTKLLLRRGKEWVRLTLDFNKGPWMSCNLTFDVPVHVTELHNAEYVGQVDDRNHVIGVKREHVVIIYQKLSSKGSKSGHIGSECYHCDHTHGHYHVVPLPPFIEPSIEPVEYSGISPITDLSPTSNQATSNLVDNQSIPFLPDYLNEHPAMVSTVVTDHTMKPQVTKSTKMLPTAETSKDSSSSSHGVWIGVAAGCAIGVIVLLIVVAALLMFRRRSSSPEGNTFSLAWHRTRTNESSNNIYHREDGQVDSSSNGPTMANCRTLPCTPPELMKGKGLPQETQYEELEVCLPDYNNSKLKNGGGMISPPSNYDQLLPGQRLNLPSQSGYDNLSPVQSPHSMPLGLYEVPDDIVESGDEDETKEEDYMSMNNLQRKQDQ
ncbi:uncharacterized protein LOC134192585 [Corticium candelabrum]|uniref:uncharacterized protein LOC134192585 n=1 Tax=Corticium candelabrum TaxID=121492 RepID=UPI002E270952|nr:uncharacterized protein LOC134192585 [Corticium candelabrum]